MSATGQALVVADEARLGLRLELARMHAGLDPEDMARAAGISRRSYARTVAGTRPARRGELLAWAELTGQEVGFFGASPDADTAVLPPPLPGFNEEPAAT